MQRVIVIWVSLITVSPIILTTFQNCAPAFFSSSPSWSSGVGIDGGTGGTALGVNTGGPGGGHTQSQPSFQLLDQELITAFNQSVQWIAAHQGDRTGFTLSLSPLSVETEVQGQNGNVQILDLQNWSLRFSPEFGFRGQVTFYIYALEGSQLRSQALVTIHVNQAFNVIRPALAVRAGGCVMCHAEIHSNIMTDFGHGDPFYFGLSHPNGFAWNDGTAWGDHEALFPIGNNQFGKGAWARLKMVNGVNTQHGFKVYVPQSASLPLGPAQATGQTTLIGYLQHRFQASSHLSTQALTVQGLSKLRIGAPSVQRLKQAFDWNSMDQIRGFKYIREVNHAWNLLGLNTGNTPPPQSFFFNSDPTVQCEGDLLLDGTLRLHNVTIRTRTGCRIYVTEDIYVHGPIQFHSLTEPRRNIQLVAARSILMGLGNLWKNNQHCEMNQQDSGYWGYYQNQNQYTAGMTAAQRQNYLTAIANSARFRLDYFWGISAAFVRGVSNPVSHHQAIFNRFMSLNGNAFDAACEWSHRNVAFERILLNAPIIHNRYAGGFKGSVIGEWVLMPLGLSQQGSRFRFEFDPVFTMQGVRVLPMLEDQDFLFAHD